jgi:hypothetical protein
MNPTPPSLTRCVRQRRTLDEARELVAAWRRSGQGKAAWCRERGVLRSALSSWLYRLADADAAPTAPSTFIAIRPPRAVRGDVVDRAVPLRDVAIDLPSGLRITGLDASGAATVIRLLGEVS